jgi:hypothetical protein
MWHIKHETDNIVLSERKVIPYDRPYLENDDGTCIRRVGGKLGSYNFKYSGILNSMQLTFEFRADFSDKKNPPFREYNVDFVTSFLRMNVLDDCSLDESIKALKLIMTHIREALSDFPNPKPIGPNTPPAVPDVSKVVFTVSISPRWNRYKDAFCGEAVV